MGSTNEPWEGTEPRALLCSCGFTSVPGPIRPPISIQPQFGRMKVWDAAQDHTGIHTGRVQHLALTITTTHSHVLVQKSSFFFLCYQEGAILHALPAPVSLLSCPEGGFTPCRGSGCCSHSTGGSRRRGRGWGPHRARGTLLPLLGAAFLESSGQSRWRDLTEVWGLRHVSGSEAASRYPYRDRGLQVGQSRDHGETPRALEVQSPLLLCHPCFLLERFPFLIIFKDDYILSSNDLS